MHASAIKKQMAIGTRLRSRRQKLNLTLVHVAQSAGISTGYLSLIEREKSTPSLTTLRRIGVALGVQLDYFVAMPDPVECITRADQRARYQYSEARLQYERLGASFPGSEFTCFIVTIAPGYESDATSHEGEESIYVLSGTLILGLDGQKLSLGAGDSAHFDSSRPHFWANHGSSPVQIHWTGTVDLFRLD